MSVNISLIVLKKKKYDIHMIFVEICHDFGWFFATRIRFIEADLDPADQYETDPVRIRNTGF